MQKRPAYETLVNELCEIKKFQHLTFGNCDTKSNIFLKFCLKGIRRFLGDKKVKLKMALTMQKLLTILADFNINIHDDLVITTAFMCAELAMLHASEFCHNKKKPEKYIYLNNFEFFPSFENCQFIRLEIRAGKTYFFRKSSYACFRKTGHKYCAVKLIKYLLKMKGIHNYGEFCTRKHELMFTFRSGKTLNTNLATNILKKQCKTYGLLGTYSLISFRKWGRPL